MERPNHPPFAVVFDVDGTLAPDTTSQFLAARGVDVASFWARAHARMERGGGPVTSFLHEFVLESRGTRGPFTRDEMAAAGTTVAFFPGAPALFARLSAHLARRGFAAEFYLISGGLAPIIAHLPIARWCRAIWASDFAYDAAGRPTFPLTPLTDKTAPLLEIARGHASAGSEASSIQRNAPVGAGDLRIPFTRIVFAGDGELDAPCFSLLTGHGGAAVAVFDPRRPGAREQALQYQAEGVVGWVAAADYTTSGEADRALGQAIDVLLGTSRRR